MAKIENSANLLDTLAQLSTRKCDEFKIKQLEQQTNFQKRAKSKAYNNSFVFDLIDLNTNLKKGYWQTYYCSNTILQDESKATARYCNQRWCLVCNRIRTAKIINGYKDEVGKFIEPQFVTLTIKNMPEAELRPSIDEMTKSLQDIRKNLKKTYGLNLKALRKYECTYNELANEFHPHFHLIVEGKQVAEKLVDLWLNKYPTANRVGQKIKKANQNSLPEIAKYFTKVITKESDYNPKALDIMFKAIKGKRTFQPIGIRKFVDENIEEIQSQEFILKEPQSEIWSYIRKLFDWVSSQGECLSGYMPTEAEMEIINGAYKQKSNENRTNKKKSKSRKGSKRLYPIASRTKANQSRRVLLE